MDVINGKAYRKKLRALSTKIQLLQANDSKTDDEKEHYPC
jgi:hypothetical protein